MNQLKSASENVLLHRVRNDARQQVIYIYTHFNTLRAVLATAKSLGINSAFQTASTFLAATAGAGTSSRLTERCYLQQCVERDMDATLLSIPLMRGPRGLERHKPIAKTCICYCCHGMHHSCQLHSLS